MAQKTDRRFLITEAQILSQISPCESCDGENYTEFGVFSEYSGFPFERHSMLAPYSSSSTCCSYKKDKWVWPGTFQKGMLFENQRTMDRSVLSHSV